MKATYLIDTDLNSESEIQLYLLDLELELDRTRRKNAVFQCSLKECLEELHSIMQGFDNDRQVELHFDNVKSKMYRIGGLSRKLNNIASQWHENSSEVFPIDHVTDINIRKTVNNIFQFEMKAHGIDAAVLLLDLEVEVIEWFPVRFIHIIENIISNSLEFRDPESESTTVLFELIVAATFYEINVFDNSLGVQMYQISQEEDSTTTKGRVNLPGVGLSVVKTLVEYCCGAMTIKPSKAGGTYIHLKLPKFINDDHV